MREGVRSDRRAAADSLSLSRNLADVADRGKLNIDEFHVAMGLIYRRECTEHRRQPAALIAIPPQA